MKSIIKCLNIFNILQILIMILEVIMFNKLLKLYDIASYVTSSIFISSLIINIIIGIICIIKKHIKIGIISIAIGIIPVLAFVIESFFNLSILTFISCLCICVFSIINLFLNNKLEKEKNKSAIIIIAVFVAVITTNAVLIIIAYNQYNEDIQAFEKALPIIAEQNSKKSYIIKENEKEYTFIDENLENIVQKQQFDSIDLFISSYRINNRSVNICYGTKDNHGVILSTSGEILLQTNTTKISDFMIDRQKQGKYNIETKMEDDYHPNNKNYNKLKKYYETNNKYEDNREYSYMYFKNEDITKKVLQVVFTKDNEDDLELMESIDYIDEPISSQVKDFYKYKKHYYLIDFAGNTKTKLECNNLIYQASGDVESIALLPNGSIPFYDSGETGYFNTNGEKTSVSKPYLVYDCTDKYTVIYDKNSLKTYLVLTKENQIEKQFDGHLISYNNFYIIAPLAPEGQYVLLDSDFNTVKNFYNSPNIIDENIILTTDSDNQNYVYLNKNGKIEEKYKFSSNNYKIISTTTPAVESSNIFTILYLDCK